MDEDTIDTKYVPTVMERKPCRRHSASQGEPCWHIPSMRRGYNPAVCGKRATAAGFVGLIRPASIRQARN